MDMRSKKRARGVRQSGVKAGAVAIDFRLPPGATALKPTNLHKLLAARTVWTVDLWIAAIEFIADTFTADEVDELVRLADPGRTGQSSWRDTESIHRQLNDYLDYPPTTLLGSFDRVRADRERHARIEQAISELHVEPRSPDYYSLTIT